MTKVDQPTSPVISISGLQKWYRTDGSLFKKNASYLKAVNDVSIDIDKGEVLGLVGESGSGKSTVGRMVLRLDDPTGGSIRFQDVDITHHSRKQLRPLRRKMQLVFQDPYSSLNPKMTVGQIIAAPLRINGMGDRTQIETAVAEILDLVGLNPRFKDRYPHEFSGGQRQRISIARALITEPEFLVADEPVSALDVSVQAQVIKLFLDVRKRFDLGMLFISHDLAVVGYVSDRIAVLYLGRIVEIAPTKSLFERPSHPYTEALISAVPEPIVGAKRRKIRLSGDIPSPINPPSGCAFRQRCPYVIPKCADAVPALRLVAPGHFKACIRDDLDLQSWAALGS
jgi:oligopeptide/dipeptide ABC transporter ATP-binding protein